MTTPTPSAAEAPSLHDRRHIDIEHMLSECVPGGSFCDPQQVADAIREYFNARPAAPEGRELPVPLTDEQIVMQGLMMVPGSRLESCADAFGEGVRFAERHYGIGQQSAKGLT